MPQDDLDGSIGSNSSEDDTAPTTTVSHPKHGCGGRIALPLAALTVVFCVYGVGFLWADPDAGGIFSSRDGSARNPGGKGFDRLQPGVSPRTSSHGAPSPARVTLLDDYSITEQEAQTHALLHFDKAEELFRKRGEHPSYLRSAILHYRLTVEYLEPFTPHPELWERARRQREQAERIRGERVAVLQKAQTYLAQLRAFADIRPLLDEIMALSSPDSPESREARQNRTDIENFLRRRREPGTPSPLPQTARRTDAEKSSPPSTPRLPENGLVFYAPLRSAADIVARGRILNNKMNFTVEDGIPCADFANRSYLTFATDVIPDGPCSISLWVKCTRLLRFETNFLSCGRDIFLRRRTGLLCVRSKLGYDKDCQAPFNFRAWNHIVFVFSKEDSGTTYGLKAYVNGKLHAAFSDTGKGELSPVGYIGTSRHQPQDYMLPGCMAAVRIYDRPLSTAEISALFHEFKPTPRQPSVLTLMLPYDVPLVMKKIPAGSFMMGSPANELGRRSDEPQHNELQHKVTIGQDFYMGICEVTNAQFAAIVDKVKPAPASHKTAKVRVPWRQALRFCGLLNAATEGTRPAGYYFTLPTEAQWEYACRAGTTTALNSGENLSSADKQCEKLDRLAWYRHSRPGNPTHIVGRKSPNAWGLYDMHGNVAEHCLDELQPYIAAPRIDPHGKGGSGVHAVRGGCWDDTPSGCRSASRDSRRETISSPRVGFRVVLVPIRSPLPAAASANGPRLPTDSELRYPLERTPDGDIVVPSCNSPGNQNKVLLTRKVYQPPYVVRAFCMITSSNVRFDVCNGEIIFNWEHNPNDLRLDLPGISSRQYGVADGFVPRNRWIAYRIEVRKDSVAIYVDGKLRHTARGNFAASPVGMHTCFLSTLYIREFSVTQQ